ncbi:hypothetical protein, partial [Brucella anthropi]|uniref:hypothetical protein n=1 Tax=Brucella anthropi TaxID=529 RepID=UPI001AEBCD4A
FLITASVSTAKSSNVSQSQYSTPKHNYLSGLERISSHVCRSIGGSLRPSRAAIRIPLYHG